MSKLIVANWKSNPDTLREAVKLAKASDFKNVVIAPPFVYLEAISRIVKLAKLGAQNVFFKDGGPYTGEVSLSQLKDLKVKYIIIGHSERRQYLGETDEIVNKKVKLALNKGFKVILCVGEDLKVRRRGAVASQRFVADQLKKDLAGIHTSYFVLRNSLIIAYEPVWAISTSRGGKPDTPQDTTQMITHIKKILDSRFQILASVLYGGSVTSRNARPFLSQPEIDGALVGGASLKSAEIKTIIKISNGL